MSTGVNDDSAEPSGRALVPVSGADSGSARTAGMPRPFAPFLAQLVATAQGVPQTRQRRRATADHAVTVYAAAGKRDRPGALVASM